MSKLPSYVTAAGRGCGLLAESARQSCRDISRTKCTYCIGCCSIFLVVIVAALAQTLVARAPLVFLREAETATGQIDVRIRANGDVGSSSGGLLNYTQFAASIASVGAGGDASAAALSRRLSYTAGRSAISARVFPRALCAADVAPYAAAGADAALSALPDWPYIGYTFNASAPPPGSGSATLQVLPTDAAFCDGYSTCVAFCGQAAGLRSAGNDGANDPANGNGVNIVLIDSAREQRGGFGRNWPAGARPIPPGQAVVSATLAKALATSYRNAPDAAAGTTFAAGGQVLLWMNAQTLLAAMLPALLSSAGSAAAALAGGSAALPSSAVPGGFIRQPSLTALSAAQAQVLRAAAQYPTAVLPVTIADLLPAATMKARLGDDVDSGVVMEAAYFAPLLLRSLHPALRTVLAHALEAAGIPPLGSGSWAATNASAPVPPPPVGSALAGLNAAWQSPAAVALAAAYEPVFAPAAAAAAVAGSLESATSAAASRRMGGLLALLGQGSGCPISPASTLWGSASSVLTGLTGDSASAAAAVGLLLAQSDADAVTGPASGPSSASRSALGIASAGAGALASRPVSAVSAALPRSCAADWFIRTIVANLPPSTRLTSYASSNYDRLRADVADHASSMLYLAGFTETDAEAPILATLEPRRFVTLYLGLVLDVLLITLFGLATLLIYSLLLVNAEAKTFEVAVRRMLGSGRPAIVLLLLTHAAMHALPAWVLGLLLAQAGSGALFTYFGRVASMPIPTALTSSSVGIATLLAWLIPAIAVVGPVRSALQRNIHDALDMGRPAAGGVIVSITQRQSGRVSGTAIVVAACAAVFGFGIYYLLPLALLSFNLSLILTFFLCVIIGMLAGLVILALNFELLMLRLLSTLLLWWERPAVRRLLWSNLSAAHRTRNRKTAAMYAIAVALICFIVVAATGQISSASVSVRAKAGAPVTFSTGGINNYPSAAADVTSLLAYESSIRAASLGGSGRKLAGASTAGPGSAAASSLSGAGFDSGSPLFAEAAPQSSSWLRHAWGSTRLEAAVAWLASAAGRADDAAGSALPPVSGSASRPWQLRLKDANTVAALDASASDAVPDALFAVSETAQRNVGRDAKWTANIRSAGPGLYRGALYLDVLTLDATLPGGLGLHGATGAAAPSSPAGTGSAPDGSDAPFSLSDVLYTAAGSQGGLFSNSMRFELAATPDSLLTLQTSMTAAPPSTSGGNNSASVGSPLGFGGSGTGRQGPWYLRSQLRAAGLLSYSPFYVFSRAPSNADYVLLPLPAMPRLLASHAEAVAGEGSLPQVPSAVLGGQLQHLYGRGAGGSWTIERCRAALQQLGKHPSSAPLSSTSFSSSSAAHAVASGMTPADWQRCMLRVMDGDALGLAAAEAAELQWEDGTFLLPSSLANGTAAGGSVGAAFNLSVAAAAAVGGAARIPRSAGSASAILPLSIADVPLHISFAPTRESADMAPASLPQRGPLADIAAGAVEPQVRKAYSDATSQVSSARWFVASSQGNVAQRGRLAPWSFATSDTSVDASELETTVTLLQLVFAVLALVAMVLCFFSLSASMLTNIREQTREIGVLRALGITRFATVRIYLHEAVLLVLGSSIWGVLIGSLVAWTFSGACQWRQRLGFCSCCCSCSVPYSIFMMIALLACLGIRHPCFPAPSRFLMVCSPAKHVHRSSSAICRTLGSHRRGRSSRPCVGLLRGGLACVASRQAASHKAAAGAVKLSHPGPFLFRDADPWGYFLFIAGTYRLIELFQLAEAE